MTRLAGIVIESLHQPWRRIGWDGLCFQTPEHWQPARIGRRHLCFTDHSTPALEIKWSPPGASPSVEQIVARLANRHREALTIGPVPTPWTRSMAGRPAAGFSWTGPAGSGQGAACRLPGGTGVIVQFLGTCDPEAQAHMIASLDDGADGGQRLWSLYDVAARLPLTYSVTGWEFAAGAFRMAFAAPNRRLVLYRFAPASVILNKTPLDRLAGTLLPKAVTLWEEPDAGEWLAAGDGLRQRLARLMGAAVETRLRLWHVAAANRILGVELTGRRLVEEDIASICGAYDCVPHLS